MRNTMLKNETEEDMICSLIETYNLDRELAEELFSKCGFNTKKIKRYLKNNSGRGLGKCKYCGRKLTDLRSIRRGYGSECYKKIQNIHYESMFGED